MPIRVRARAVLRAVVWIVVLGTGLLMLLGRCATALVLGDSWVLARIAAVGFAASVLVLQLAIMLLGAAVVAFCCRARRLAVVALAISLTAIGPAMWRMVPAHVDAPKPGEPVLRVMAINCLFQNATAEKLAGRVLEADPDVLVLEEYVPRLDDVVRPMLNERMPHQYVMLRQTNRGQAIYSKLPLTDAHELLLGSGDWGAPALSADVEWNGSPVTIVSVHLPSPITIDLLKQSAREIEALAELARSASGNLVIAGDFNSPTTTWQYHTLIDAGLTESFAAAGSGSGVTRPTHPFPPGELGGIRIDHIFASPSLRFVSSVVGPETGSDHRPVIAELVRQVPVSVP